MRIGAYARAGRGKLGRPALILEGLPHELLGRRRFDPGPHHHGEGPTGHRPHKGRQSAEEDDPADVRLHQCHGGERPRGGWHHGVGELHGAHEAGGHDAHVQSGLQRRRVDEGVQDHVAHVREDRDTDDESAQRERQRHPPFTRPTGSSWP
jgi:hypothetical protein